MLHNGRVTRHRCRSVAEVESHLEAHWDQAFACQAGQWYELVDARWKKVECTPKFAIP